MRITCLPTKGDVSGWYGVLEHQPARTLQQDVSADWVVVGGGFAGLAAARRLAELHPDDRIVLLEACRVGMNTSGSNAGFAIDLPHTLDAEAPEHDQRQIRLNRAAINWLGDLVQHHQIQCQWSPRGKLHGAATRRGRAKLDAMSKRLDSIGEPYERWDEAKTREHLGTGHFQEAIYTPGCVLLQPAALVIGLARSMPANVEVYEDSAVLAFDDGPVKTLTTASGSVAAPRVILATNGWTPAFGFLKQRLLPIYSFGSLTRPLTEAEQQALGGSGDWGVIPAVLGSTSTTMRHTQDNRILIRKNVAYHPDFVVKPEELTRVRKSHEKTLRRRFPMLPELEFEHTWSCVFCMSRNHVPKCGPLADGVWAAVCQNGVGIARGTISGRTVAEMASGEDTDFVRDMMAFDDLKPFPNRWITGLGVRVRMATAALRVGAEA